MNTKLMISLISALTIVLSSVAAESRLTRDQRISDAQTLVSLFEHRYAPFQWKKDYLEISLDDLTAKLMSEIYRDDMTDEEFYTAMARFSGGVRDTHNWFLIPSTYRADLGFTCDYVDGNVLISEVDRKVLPEEAFPFERGDELIQIDGRPAIDIIGELSELVSEGNEFAQARFLAIDLTHRSQRNYPNIPSGKSALEIFSQSRGAAETVTVEWLMSGTPLVDRSPEETTGVSAITKKSTSSGVNVSPLERLRWSAIDSERTALARIRDPKPFFGLWDSFVERTTKPLYSGIFLLDDKRIGFIRIPTWYPPDGNEWIGFLEKEIPFLEAETDALLIDQTDNGGGWICLGESISEFFVSEPIPANLFQIRANRYFLEMMEEWFYELNEEKDNSLDSEIAKKILNEIKKAIEDGRPLTEPVSLCFSDGYIHPHVTAEGKTTVYTKPILMLTNEWSISTADMTPAPLQDAGRVVIFGGRTCGAGGNVTTTSAIGYSDFRISQTESLTVRPKPVMTPGGIETRYIENVGVIPDVEYGITVDDFMGGYTGYRTAIEETLRMMLKGK